MKNLFFNCPWNKHTLLNVIRTVAKNGLAQPFRLDAPLVVVWNYTNLCNLRCRYCYQSAGASMEDELPYEKKIDLVDQMVDGGKHRHDLTYRVAVIPLTIPPLRERKCDILPVADFFTGPKRSDYVLSHNWPENVRELKNVVERAILLAESGNILENLIFDDESDGQGRKDGGDPGDPGGVQDLQVRDRQRSGGGPREALYRKAPSPVPGDDRGP